MHSKRPYIIAIDFDDTIAINSFPNLEKDTLLKPYVSDIINKLFDEGYYIIIWTCRYLDNHINEMKEFLLHNNIPYDSINENYPCLEFKPYPKIYADIYIDDKSLLNIDWKWIYEYIKVNLINTPSITSEMKEHYFNRTKNHIELFNKYYSMLGHNTDYLNKHDKSKFYNPELEYYIWITWEYHCKKNNIPFSISQNIRNRMNEVTEYHIKNNDHHPEFWTSQKTNLINKDNRDSNDVTKIDGTLMPLSCIEKMCCDWKAVSIEKNTSVYDWANNNINIRWKFNSDQVQHIYDTLKKLDKGVV